MLEISGLVKRYTTGDLAGPAGAADKAPVAKPTPDREELTISTEEMTRPWSGDLDGMIDRRTIRFLTVYSKTF